jgi:hypothetical protein
MRIHQSICKRVVLAVHGHPFARQDAAAHPDPTTAAMSQMQVDAAVTGVAMQIEREFNED